MPSTPEIEQKLREQQQAKKRGDPITFAQARQEFSSGYRTPERNMVPTDGPARELVDMETLFGQQCVALGAQLRAMLATLGQLQRARMRAFGMDHDLRDLDKEDLRRQAESAVSIGEDGFVRNDAAGSRNDTPKP